MPSIRRRGNRWMVLYRDETGRQAAERRELQQRS